MLKSLRWPVGRAAMTVAIVVFALLASILVVQIVASYFSARDRINGRVELASQIVATNAEWIDALARQALRRIEEIVARDPLDEGGKGVRDVREIVAGLPGQVRAYIVDARGQTLFSTDPQIKPVSITDREYFAVLKRGAKEYTSPLLVSRLNGEQIFVYSRRIDRNKAFAGAAIVSFSAAILMPVWKAVDLGAHSTVGLIRDDGQLIARYPFPSGPVDLSKYVLFTDYLKRRSSGVYEALSPVDNIRRVVGYRRVSGTDIVVQASASYDENMKPFWESTLLVLSFLLVSVVAMTFGLFWIRSLLRQEAAQSAELTRSLEHNRILMQEIHHRVKNNLQSVQSLISIQPMDTGAKRSILDRLNAMSKVHETIYTHDSFEEIRADQLVERIVDPLVLAYNPAVGVTYRLAELIIDNARATPFALLLSEAVTNALKYAFSDNAAPALEISLQPIAGARIELRIRDNGPGFEPGTSHRGMGSRLIDGSAAQLNGDCHYEFDKGTALVVRFSPSVTA